MPAGYVQPATYGVPRSLGLMAPQYTSANNRSSLVIPAFGAHPDAVPLTTSSLDDEFPGNTLHQKWIPLNQGAATYNIANSLCIIHPPIVGSDNMRCLYQSIGAGPWTITAKMTISSPANTFNQGGIFARNSGSGKIIKWNISPPSDNNWQFQLGRMNSPTSANASVSTFGPGSAGPVYMRMTNDGTNLQMFHSYDGTAFHPWTIEALATFVISTDSVGIYADCIDGITSPYVSFDWFRSVPYKLNPF